MINGGGACSGRMDFIELRGDVAVFQQDPDMTWGTDQGGRMVEVSEFQVDKKYWEILGCPAEIVFMFGNEEGFKDRVGSTPPEHGTWERVSE